MFEYASKGLTDELFAAFERKEASPYDCDSNGWSLLDVSSSVFEASLTCSNIDDSVSIH